MTQAEKKEEPVVDIKGECLVLIVEAYRRYAFPSGVVFSILAVYHTLRDSPATHEPWLLRIMSLSTVSFASFGLGFVGWPVVWPVVILDHIVN
jgi:hypothetical protein